jgi:protoheme IX farnesyltransferase
MISAIKSIAELAKIRISAMAALTAAAGYLLFSRGFSPGIIVPMTAAFFLACGACALNQIQERRLDALMKRTRGRPLPSGRITLQHALIAAALFITAGLAILLCASFYRAELLLLGAAAIFWYNVAYTYLKRVTAFAAVIGAFLGAVPPVVGWVAAGGYAADGRILAVAILFYMWQIPHFWLLVLKHRGEYLSAGVPSIIMVFNESQLGRIVFNWIAALAVAGPLTFALIGFGWKTVFALSVPSLLLTLATAPVLLSAGGRQNYGRIFAMINSYALLLTLALAALSAL